MIVTNCPEARTDDVIRNQRLCFCISGSTTCAVRENAPLIGRNVRQVLVCPRSSGVSAIWRGAPGAVRECAITSFSIAAQSVRRTAACS